MICDTARRMGCAGVGEDSQLFPRCGVGLPCGRRIQDGSVACPNRSPMIRCNECRHLGVGALYVQLGYCPVQFLVAPNCCDAMSVGTEKWESIVQVVARKLMWRRTGEGLEARRARVPRGLAQHRCRRSWIAGRAVRSNDRVAEGRCVGRRSDWHQTSGLLEVRVGVRGGSLTLRVSICALHRAVGQRATGGAGPGAIGSSRCE